MDEYLRVNRETWNTWTQLNVASDSTIAAPNAPIHSVTYVWIHALAEIIASLLRAGRRIEAFDEYPFVRWTVLPWMERRADGGWQLPPGQRSIPLRFSLKATKADPTRPLASPSAL